MIKFEDFQKIDLRIGKVVLAEKVEDSEKLMRLEVDLGNEKKQIIAGIQQFYGPKELIGKEILIVVNLEPKVVFGLESQGMLLAADDNGKPVLLIPDREVPPGAKIS